MNIPGNTPTTTNGITAANAATMNTEDTTAVFRTPNTLHNVWVPTIESAAASNTSFVAVPPNKNTEAIAPIAKGRLWNGSANTLHDARIPRRPRGTATHNWLMTKNRFILGHKEYVTENKVMPPTKHTKTKLTRHAQASATRYNRNATQ